MHASSPAPVLPALRFPHAGPQRGPETHHSQPKDYPFKLKAAIASLAVTGERAIPVFCGLAIGADAPKSF